MCMLREKKEVRITEGAEVWGRWRVVAEEESCVCGVSVNSRVANTWSQVL